MFFQIASSLFPSVKYVSDQTCMNLFIGPVQHPEIDLGLCMNGTEDRVQIEDWWAPAP